MLETLTIIMVFISLEYKQSVLSFVLFLPVSITSMFPIRQTQPLHTLRTIILFVIIIEYLI